jgi:hypothetical protein
MNNQREVTVNVLVIYSGILPINFFCKGMFMEADDAICYFQKISLHWSAKKIWDSWEHHMCQLIFI